MYGKARRKQGKTYKTNYEGTGKSLTCLSEI